MTSVEESLASGTVRFWGLDLIAAPSALVARTETETLASTVIAILLERASKSGPQVVVDMCTGSGNLACAIGSVMATEAPGTLVHASDISDGSVRVARQNVAATRLSAFVTIHQGDLFEPLRDLPEITGSVDVVVCNPPYISTGKLDKERADLLRHEPREAFDGGPYGIAIHQRVVREALSFLKPGGVLALEVGAGQARQVGAIFVRAKEYEPVLEVLDDAGEVRVVFATKKRLESPWT